MAQRTNRGRRRAFFAYPASPRDLAATIDRAVKAVDSSIVEITPWPQLDIFGAFIPDQIRQAILDSDICYFDVTVPNPNVYYELGYAIGLGKPIGPVLDNSFDGAERAIQRQGIFDNVGHKSYENSSMLTQLIQSSPKAIMLDNYSKEVNYRQPLFILDT